VKAGTSNERHLKLRLMRGRLAVCRLDAGAPIPDWVSCAGGFLSITRTRDELSIVCAEAAVCGGVKCELGWRLFEMEGPFDFDITGILLSVLQPLDAAGVSILVISTYDTDYLLVKEITVETAVRALEVAGHSVVIE